MSEWDGWGGWGCVEVYFGCVGVDGHFLQVSGGGWEWLEVYFGWVWVSVDEWDEWDGHLFQYNLN